MKPLLTLLIVCALTACASGPVTKPAAVSAALPDSVHWFRDSAEQKAVYVQTYRAATDAARALGAGLAAGSWGVILDVDETILDNSDYAKRLADTGEHFSPETWKAWVEERKATALPGVKRFIDTVIDDLRGRVVLVTNRTENECPATEDNLRNLQLRYDRILCDRAGDGNKNERFRSVIDGETGTPAVNVVLWIGDNIQDFPLLTQAAPGDLSPFGVRYFALPDPLYGSWQNVPPR